MIILSKIPNISSGKVNHIYAHDFDGFLICCPICTYIYVFQYVYIFGERDFPVWNDLYFFYVPLFFGVYEIGIMGITLWKVG